VNSPLSCSASILSVIFERGGFDGERGRRGEGERI